MPIWRVKSVTETPEVELSHWRVFEAVSQLWEGRTRHFVGYNYGEYEGRVSSAIKEFDPSTRRGVTRSGRIYQLLDGPGSGSQDGLYVWNWFCTRNQITEFVDVTAEFALASEG